MRSFDKASPSSIGAVIVAVRGSIATIVRYSRDHAETLGKGEFVITHRAAQGMVHAQQRGQQQPETLISEGSVFSAALLKDDRYKSGVLSSWADHETKFAAQAEARNASRNAVRFLNAVIKAQAAKGVRI